MATDKFMKWRGKVFETKDISPLWFGMTQEEVMKEFGKPDTTSTEIRNGRPLIFKYYDIEFHFDERENHILFLVYSDETNDLSIRAFGFPSLTKNRLH